MTTPTTPNPRPWWTKLIGPGLIALGVLISLVGATGAWAVIGVVVFILLTAHCAYIARTHHYLGESGK